MQEQVENCSRRSSLAQQAVKEQVKKGSCCSRVVQQAVQGQVENGSCAIRHCLAEDEAHVPRAR
eukprot:365318-Chlamydomonas_euryale.AAC.10